VERSEIEGTNLLAPEPPQELIGWSDLQARRELARWSASDLPEAAGWIASGGAMGRHGRCLNAGGGSMALAGPRPPELAAANLLEVQATGVQRSRLQVTAVDAAGALVATQSLVRSDAIDPAREIFRFHLPEGRAARSTLRLSVGAEPDRSLCIVRLAWLSEAPDPEVLAARAQRPWRLDLQGEVRDAILATPARGLEVPLPRSAPGELEVGYGVVGEGNARYLFEVEADLDGDWRSIWRSERSVGSADGWRDARLGQPGDIGPRGVRLSARLESPGPAAVVPVWSHLRIVPGRRSSPARPNVLLISIDTLRQDRMSLYGNARITTPHLDAWAQRRAVVFEQAVAAAPWTLPSHVSMLTGLEAFHHGVISTTPAPTGLEFLQESLAANGYRTLAVTGTGYLHPRYGIHQGFQRYRYWAVRGRRRAELEHGIDWASRMLRERSNQPFFLFFHTFEVHAPYRARQPFFGEFSGLPSEFWVMPERSGQRTPGEREARHRLVMFRPDQSEQVQEIPPELASLPLDLYDSGVAIVDAALGKLFDLLRELDLERDTLVVVTSDHGEALGEHDLAGHGFLYDDNLLVPLMVSLPGPDRGGHRIALQVRSIDIYPTILDVVGLPPPTRTDGRSLRPLALGSATSFEPEAWSHSSELGVSLRLGAREKILLFDGIVEQRSDLDRFFRLDLDPGELANRIEDLAQRPELTTEILRRINGLGRGLRLSIRGLEVGARLGLEATWLEPDALRWAGTPSDAVAWSDQGVLTLVGRGTENLEMLAWIDGPPAGSLDVWLEGERRQIALAEAGLEPGVRYRASFASDRFLPAARGPDRGQLALEIWLQGDIGSGAPDPAQTDAALREQLRALGYL